MAGGDVCKVHYNYSYHPSEIISTAQKERKRREMIRDRKHFSKFHFQIHFRSDDFCQLYLTSQRSLSTAS